MELIEKLHTQITYKQLSIIYHLYRFRYLNRKHIQTLMKHKDYKRINVWLKDLVEKGYIERIYTTSMPENTKPAVYYIGKYARRVLQGAEIGTYVGFEEVGAEYCIEKEHIRKLYKDGEKKESFRHDCLAIADCYLVIDKSIDRTNKQVRSITHNEIDNDPFLEELKPDLEISLFSIPEDNETEEYDPEDDESYYLYYVSNRKLRKYIAYRIAHVCNYVLTNEDFVDFANYGKHTILFIAANIPLRNFVMGIVKRKLNKIYDNRRITFKFATFDEFKKYGLYNTPWKIIMV